MDLFHDPLNGFSPEMYIATLWKLAHSDGLHPSEQELLEGHAARFGVNLGALPDVPEDLTDLAWATRVLVYRDAVMLSLADEHLSVEEQEYLSELADRMELSAETADAISEWVKEFGSLLERFDSLIDREH